MPDRRTDADSLRASADALAARGRYREAAEIYRELTRSAPDDESHRLALAWAHYDAGETEQAIRCFEELFERELSRDVFTGFAFDELARIFKERRLYDRLVRLCERVAAVQPDDAGLLAELGDAYLRSNRAGEAADAFRRILAIDRDDAWTWSLLGHALIAGGDLPGAEEAYAEAERIEPESALSFARRKSQALLEAGRLAEAEAALRHGLAIRTEPLDLVLLAETLIRRNRIPEALEACRKAAALQPPSGGAFFHRLGLLLESLGKDAEAAEAFRGALRAEPGNSRYRLRLSAACSRAGVPVPAEDGPAESPGETSA
ncbi:MAG: tetratricopeptide repeat protein [Syntrophales bacterium]|jgi:tetratricopeptide (TPR) repeat protein|nr:tetratricopeptide repeat protein [Syntrophales bacterium]